MEDMLKWVFKDVTHKQLDDYYNRLKSEGKLIEHETSFGTITLMKTDVLDDDPDECHMINAMSNTIAINHFEESNWKEVLIDLL